MAITFQSDDKGEYSIALCCEKFQNIFMHFPLILPVTMSILSYACIFRANHVRIMLLVSSDLSDENHIKNYTAASGKQIQEIRKSCKSDT